MTNISMKKFYMWWVSILLVATGTFWAHYLGLISKIWVTDVTMITSVIAILYIASNILLGLVAFKLDANPDNSNTTFTDKATSTIWFMSEQIMALGMLGTVIGLIHMLSTNGIGTNVQDADAIQKLLTNLWTSMGLALYTNAVGLIASIALKLQVYFIASDSGDEA